ncbi:hypothetical protein NUW54_g6412 [Trametes sanguinea]|uniref:Uncharacterized protein n=1 Tax=Trametes sanguinea TaxID=158606 RepID=A0ACC1PTC3_9APHY|nr:hypothetical protein NUW54_g6412 [Trametes sanguinea]
MTVLSAPAAAEAEEDDHPIMLDEEGWPSWLREAFDYMENQRLGKEFMRAVEWWTVLERAHDFETSSRGLGTTHRPPEVHHWLRVQRRVLDKTPIIADEAPTACCGGSGGLICSPTGANAINGLLIVLLSLVWWHMAASSETLDDWNMAVADVAYVVMAMARRKLNEDQQIRESKRRREGAVDDDQQPLSKRRRVPL